MESERQSWRAILEIFEEAYLDGHTSLCNNETRQLGSPLALDARKSFFAPRRRHLQFLSRDSGEKLTQWYPTGQRTFFPRMRSKPAPNSILEMVKACPRWSEPFMYYGVGSQSLTWLGRCGAAGL